MIENFTTLPTYYLSRGRHLDPNSVLSQVCIHKTKWSYRGASHGHFPQMPYLRDTLWLEEMP